MAFPCHPYLPDPDTDCFRAVSVGAPAEVLFRWLCQLKIAPYSYDLLDNGGRRSPRTLSPGAEHLAPGQRVMRIFRLVAFEQDAHLTMVLDDPRARSTFGHIALSYVVVPSTRGSCRLVVKLRVRYPASGLWSWQRWLLPWGDLVMMRKQLLTLKAMAEGSFHQEAMAVSTSGIGALRSRQSTR